MENKSILANLLAVQRELKVEKGQTNKFGGYNYRSAEDIIEKAKPLCIENGLLLTTTDEMQQVCDRIYLVVTATVTDILSGESFSTKAMAREPLSQKGMSESQLTGTAESYAKKRALGNLFAIDDTKDPDTGEYRRESQNRAGASGNGNANNVTRNGGNAPQTGAQAAKTANDKASAVRALNEEMKRTGASGKEVQQIAEAMVHKSSVNDMTAYEVALLAKNLEAELAKRAGA